jgi:sulfur relay (sulfurtransferase) complex TusBCD TusD component (DsrE family)
MKVEPQRRPTFASQYLRKNPLAGIPPAKGALQNVQQMQQLRPRLSTPVQVCPLAESARGSAKVA